MRTGVVIAYNKNVQQGIIKDGNGQKINFFNEDVKIVYHQLDIIRFEIAPVNGRLMAINISPVIDNGGKRVTLATEAISSLNANPTQ